MRKAGVRIKCKHHSLEVSEDDIVLSLNEPGGGAESSCGAAVGSIESGRGSSTSLKHLLERDESGEIVILTPSKITIENYPMLVSRIIAVFFNSEQTPFNPIYLFYSVHPR